MFACACAGGGTTRAPPTTSVAGDDSSSDDGATGGGECVPGQQNPCLCEDGSSGVQTCEPDGASYGMCNCFGGAETSAGSSGANQPESSGADSMSSESGPMGDPCMEEPDDDECGLCTKTNCCDELSECAADPACACVLSCIEDSENPDQLAAAMECAGPKNCDTDLGSLLIPLMNIQTCQQNTCATECGA